MNKNTFFKIKSLKCNVLGKHVYRCIPDKLTYVQFENHQKMAKIVTLSSDFSTMLLYATS